MIGQMLDRYRIEAKLGEGGMGVVYKARDTHLDRLVAIKVLPSDKVSDPERKQRFAHEAKAASALNHRHIITVHDIRADSGIDFIVMEYATGRTLDQVIRSKGLGVVQSLRYGAQIADALACAHEVGILHRDLKPSNVIVTDDDNVKVLDFGLAKLFDPADRAQEMHTRTASMTGAGMVVGTAAYMSPEQAEGRKVDARSDIFSFGVLLFEMVTGRRPFVGDSQIAVIARILNEDPPVPSTIAAGIPPDVERAILRCLRKDPARRYQTMADLKVVLEDLAAESASGRLPQPASIRPSNSWRWAWGGLIPIALIAAYFAWPFLSQPGSPSPAMQAIPLTPVPGVKRFPSFSPDGNHVTFTWTGPTQDNQDVYVQQIEAGTPLRLTTNAAMDYAPVWSPDGRSIAFLRQTADPQLHEIRLIPPLGGSERKLTEIRSRGFLRPVTMAWCPDSSCLLVTDSQNGVQGETLSVVVIETSEKRQLTTSSPEYLADTDPAISPDGRWLAFRRDVAPFSGRLYVVPLTADLRVSGDPRPLTSVLLTAYGPKWISNSEILFAAKGALWRMSTSPGSTPERLPFVGEDGLMPAVSQPRPDGTARLAYARSYTDANIWRIDLAAQGAVASAPPVVAVASTRRDSLVHLSGDGRRVTFVSDRSGESEVWAADISGSNAVQLTSLAANPGFPRWAPDGRTVAFHSNAEERPAGDVYVVPADGGKPRNLTMHAATDTFPSFSRDGLSIYFSSTRSGTPFIWKIPVAGGDAVRVSPGNGMLAIESIDRESIFYVETSTTNAPGPLWQVPLKGGDAVKLADSVLSNSFEVIEGGIYFFDRIANDTRLRYFDLTTRVATTVAEKLGTVGPCLGVSRDGRTILFARADSTIEDLMLVEHFR